MNYFWTVSAVVFVSMIACYVLIQLLLAFARWSVDFELKLKQWIDE